MRFECTRGHDSQAGEDCKIKCVACGGPCGKHIPAVHCRFLDPDPRRAWVDGWAAGRAECESQISDLLHKLEWDELPSWIKEEADE